LSSIRSFTWCACVCALVAGVVSSTESCGSSDDHFADATVDAGPVFVIDAMSEAEAGVCPNNTCAPHWADCDHDASDGCEVNLNSTVTSCGSCGHVCPDAGPDGGPLPFDAVPICTDGGCDWYCAPVQGVGELYTRCNDQCVYFICDPQNCGGCGIVCPKDDAGDAGGNQVCNVGTCGCPFGTVDCDGIPECGYECKNLNTDPNNCGICGRQCPQDPALGPFNETYTCDGPNPDGGLPGCDRVCVQERGNLWLDCNGDMLLAPDAGDGCETFGWGSQTNCGACGLQCDGGAVCHPVDQTTTKQECGCQSPLSYCDSYPYCRNLEADPYNCGGCNIVCPTYPHTLPTCAGGTCGYECVYGWADCNHIAADGCEVDILNDPNNCGGCVAGCDSGVGCGAVCQKNGAGQLVQRCQNGVCATEGCGVN
jgi:hypothetical protein